MPASNTRLSVYRRDVFFAVCPSSHHVVVFAAGHGAGVYVAGKVNSGYVQVGENVYVLPAQEVAYIKCEFAGLLRHCEKIPHTHVVFYNSG